MDIGLINYLLLSLYMAAIYAIMTLGLNFQWGMAGLFNIGIAVFFAIGAYTYSILSSPDVVGRLGGFNAPIALSIILAGVISALFSYPIGKICLRFRADYLAISTIGFAEIVHLFIKGQDNITGGVLGIQNVAKPFTIFSYSLSLLLMLGLILAIVFSIYYFSQKHLLSPWGRMMNAVKDDEVLAKSIGKNIEKSKLEVFILGSFIMGISGAMFAALNGSMSPEAINNMVITFLVWIMLILGGSGSNKGALIGSFIIWAIWSGTEIITNMFPSQIAIESKYMRLFLIGLFLQVILQFYPKGLIKNNKL